jgi:hypothetical protein
MSGVTFLPEIREPGGNLLQFPCVVDIPESQEWIKATIKLVKIRIVEIENIKRHQVEYLKRLEEAQGNG